MANPNPTPFKKTGADANPNGRPKREWTWSGVLEDAMEEVKQTKDGTKLKVKEIVAKSLIAESIKGNVAASKEIMNRMDGMPEQNVNSTLKGDLSVIIDKHGFKLSEETTDSVDESLE